MTRLHSTAPQTSIINFFSSTFLGKFSRQSLPQSPSNTKEIPVSHQANPARVERKHRTPKGRGERGDRTQSHDWDITIKTADLISISCPTCNTFSYLRSVMVEYDSVQVSTVIMLDEIFSGIRGLQTTCSEAFVLEQSLVQSKQHL